MPHVPRAARPPAIIYAGIDEAGYGPLLGPLCLALAVFRAPLPPRAVSPGVAPTPDASTGAVRPPDLWRALRSAVCKEPRHARSGRLAINDSKKVKLANGLGAPGRPAGEAGAGWPGAPRETLSAHALTHLEAGVLCFLGAADAVAGSGAETAGAPIASDDDLLRALGADLERHPWYVGAPLALPVAHTHESLRIRGNCLRAALASAGVSCLSLRARAVGESAFNDGCRRWGSKAAVNFRAASSLLREVWDRWAVIDPGAEPLAPGGPRVVVDRQGGRAHYAPALRGAFPEAAVEILDERERVSRYRLRADEREMTVLFQVEAEQAHLPVALASMTAKYLRELAMARLNRHFTSRAPSLAPTAGYAQDARRWLRDASPILTADMRRALIRVR